MACLKYNRRQVRANDASKRTERQTQGAGTESRDSTLAVTNNKNGRAALDGVTRNILGSVSSGNTRCWLPPGEGKEVAEKEKKQVNPALERTDSNTAKTEMAECLGGSKNLK